MIVLIKGLDGVLPDIRHEENTSPPPGHPLKMLPQGVISGNGFLKTGYDSTCRDAES